MCVRVCALGKRGKKKGREDRASVYMVVKGVVGVVRVTFLQPSIVSCAHCTERLD